MTFEGIALGCGNFGGIGSAPDFFGQGIAEDEAFAIMDRAWENGIHWFDTGDAYGGGTSERWIGAWRADRRPEGLQLTTKVFHSTTGTPGDTGLAPDRIRRQLESSLERLGVDRVDLYLAHEPDDAVPARRHDRRLRGGAGRGADRRVGPVELRRRRRLGGASPRHPGAAAKPVLAARCATTRSACCRSASPTRSRYVPFGPLSGGWLTGKYRRGESFPEGSRMTQRPGPYERFVSDAVFDGLDRLREEAEARGVDMAAVAFAWVLASPGVAGAVCGPNRAEQLSPVLAARELGLSPDDRDRIGRFFEA